MSFRSLDVQGRNVHIFESGSGKPVLYLHGVADLHGAVDKPFEFHDSLAKKCNLIAPAHPGCVQSDEDETIESIDDLAFHTLEVMDALGLDKVDILGTCVGGWLAAEIAVRNPERVNSLGIIGAPGLFVTGSPIGDLFMAVQPLNGGIADLRSMLFSDGEGALSQSLFGDEIKDKEQGMLRYKIFRCIARFGFKPPYFYHPKLRNRLHRFKGRSLIVWGSEDKFVPTSHATAYSEGFENNTLALIEGSGHAVHLEKPKLVAEKFSDFLTV